MKSNASKAIAAILLLCTSAVVCADPLNIAVAASLQYVFKDLQAEFKKVSGQDVHASFNASGKFAAQIMNGAPFDVFLSADVEFPAKLYEAGFAVEKPKVYAFGALVLWTMKNLDLRDWGRTVSAAGLGKIAVANPQTAPYGRATMTALSRAGLDAVVKDKLVFGESIAQTNQYIYSGVADVGFTAESVVLSPELAGKGKWVALPRNAYEPIAQGVVILKHSQQANAALARQFVDFLFSGAARTILANAGYTQ
ncbi:MAG: molybdate ABC transporter substrate-binding protein [Burkholderiaceae bacterium]|nr:molybdate ABC transporter substrate-binding protein [Burkholderiaceae bacterium]